MAEVLELELATYKRLLPSLLKDEGKYAVIKGEALIGIFDSYSDALAEGYKVAKLKPFLVKKIAATETVAYFSRDVDSACITAS
ncbi:MAG TPA: hypothetical protein VII49_09420 [Rhizomicrobium sp.]